MAVFSYQAKTKTGQEQAGKVEAKSEQAALDILQRNDLVVLNIVQEDNKSTFKKDIKILERVNDKDLSVFSQQLSTLFSVSVPLVISLHTLANQMNNPKLQRAVLDIAANIDGGMQFSEALAEYPDIFSNFYIEMVKAGEASGTLDEVLDYLADYTQRMYEINSQIKGAMTYPAFILTAFVGIFVLMLTVVLPQLIVILEDLGAELPMMTQVVIALSEGLRNYWFLIVAFLGAGVYALFHFLKTEEGKKIWHTIQLKMPILGRLFENIYMFRFASTFSALVKGGVPINEALDITARVVGNVVFRDILQEAQEGINKGESISSTLRAHPEFSGVVTQMVATGEQSGQVDVILETISGFYEKEIDSQVDNMVSLIEPILIVVLGVGVGLLLAAVLMPIYTAVTAF